MKELIQRLMAKLAERGIEATPGEVALCAFHATCRLDSEGIVHGGPASIFEMALDDELLMDDVAEWFIDLHDPSIEKAVCRLEESAEHYRKAFKGEP